MGRQTAIIATHADEQSLLAFVRQIADVRLFVMFAPSAEALWTEEIAPERVGNFRYHIWNTSFPWEPLYGQVGPQASDPSRIGWYFVRNASAAPVIEFDRSRFNPIGPGRLYWAKHFSAPHGLDYDVVGFSKWYDSVVRWIRRQGKREGSAYYLPDAWARRVELG
jgi:hypothetical protein